MTKCDEVIITDELRRGNGNTTPIRRVVQVFSKEGKLIAENDPSAYYGHYHEEIVLGLIAYMRRLLYKPDESVSDKQLLAVFIQHLPPTTKISVHPEDDV